MQFAFNARQSRLKEDVAAFVEGVNKKQIEACEKASEFPYDLYREISKRGWAGIMVPTEFGGLGLGAVEMAIVTEEMGLLGLAFHPDYEQNGFFYVNYTGDGGHTRISRFQAGGNSADSNSETVLLIIEQPYPNHNGGALAFGPDGYLYAGLGDGGLAGDPHKNGQNTTALLGKILRIDVDNGNPYTIPSDNPFGNEVWAYGLRNPWRISFDRATSDLWIGDVGQGQWEEIDYLPAGSQGGANFGWSIMEGNHGYDGEAQPGLLLPAAEYSHNERKCSVTGGYVYRGSLPEWYGIYLYGDYCTGYVWGLIQSANGWQSQIMFETGVTITSFGQDESGEIYLASDNGNVYQLTKK